MDPIVENAKLQVRQWTDRHRQAVLYDEADSAFLDIASAKSVTIAWRDLTAFETKIHPETNDAYLVLRFENGHELALVDPGGVAFAPSTENTGPLAILPPVVCLRDFLTLKGRVDHYLYDHRDEPPPRKCVDLIMICIATLDGARKVGFDVADLERALDKSLSEVERRTGWEENWNDEEGRKS